MKQYFKKILFKFGFFATIFGSLLFILILIGVMSTYQNAQSLMSKKYDDDKLEELSESYVGDHLPLNADVEGLRTKVYEQALLYGTQDYTDLFLAVIMQESSGHWIDVFQCSESMGLPPNSIDTQTSIEQGVMLLSSYLTLASVESTTDIVHIRLALQAYNFGKGFINFAIENYGGWSQEATDEYAKIYSKEKKRTGTAAETMGVWRYGDQFYSDHVLRYYMSFSGDAGSVVEEALILLGCDYEWGATGPNTFDCSGLVYYVFKKTGEYTGPRTTAAGYKSIASPVSENDVQEGDLVFFSTSSKGTHHVGIYIGDGKMIHAPRTGDVVKISNVQRNGEIISYGRLSN